MNGYVHGRKFSPNNPEEILYMLSTEAVIKWPLLLPWMQFYSNLVIYSRGSLGTNEETICILDIRIYNNSSNIYSFPSVNKASNNIKFYRTLYGNILKDLSCLSKKLLNLFLIYVLRPFFFYLINQRFDCMLPFSRIFRICNGCWYLKEST